MTRGEFWPGSHATSHRGELDHVFPAVLLPALHGPALARPLATTGRRANLSPRQRSSLICRVTGGALLHAGVASFFDGLRIARALNLSATNGEFGDHVRGGIAESLESSGGLHPSRMENTDGKSSAIEHAF